MRRHAPFKLQWKGLLRRQLELSLTEELGVRQFLPDGFTILLPGKTCPDLGPMRWRDAGP
jgi:hypothetical protein